MTICTTHEAMHLIFGEDARHARALSAPATPPALGDVGEKVSADSVFDGWGYVHLFRNTGTDLEPVDDYAIEEALDPRYAQGFGDLSVHEWATDPNANLGYVAYYAGGMRVVPLRGRRPRGDRQVHRRGRQQLLGRRGLHDAAGRAPVRRLRPRLRPVPVPVHRAGASSSLLPRPRRVRRP